ncbi:MAG: hypothetical protein ACP5R5_11880 [Armatimonadota bacterium]
MPKIPEGVYTVVLSYQTDTDLGVVWSKRQVRVEFPFYETLESEYRNAKHRKNLAAMEKAVSRVLAGWKGRRVKPGETVKVATVFIGKPKPDKLSAVARWYADRDGFRVEVEVIDACFGANAAKVAGGSSASLYFAPSGFDDTRTRFTIVPSGPENAPIIEADAAGPIEAAWKRTADGYHVTARIPEGSIKGYRKGWTLVPVDVTVNSESANDRSVVAAGAAGEPVGDEDERSVRYYLGLVR